MSTLGYIMLPVLLLNLQLVVGGVKEFPDPQKEWRMCGMPRPAFVCDPHFVLPRGDAEKLDQIAAEFRKSTSCLCPACDSGVSLGVFIGHNASREEYPTGKVLAEALRKRWALSPCGADILIVLLTQQNTSDFSLGPAVAKVLPESTVSQIFSECRVHFESGWHYQGLESVANSLNDVLVRLQRVPRPVFRNLVLGIGLGFGTLLILALAALAIVHRQNRRRTKSYCSDILEGVPTTNNRRKPSFNQAEHLEKLRRLDSSEEDDEDDEEGDSRFVYNKTRSSSSVQFARINRQLSDVLEETQEDMEGLKRYSFTPSPRVNVPVTEL